MLENKGYSRKIHITHILVSSQFFVPLRKRCCFFLPWLQIFGKFWEISGNNARFSDIIYCLFHVVEPIFEPCLQLSIYSDSFAILNYFLYLGFNTLSIFLIYRRSCCSVLLCFLPFCKSNSILLCVCLAYLAKRLYQPCFWLAEASSVIF